jgi:hypothetical protein
MKEKKEIVNLAVIGVSGRGLGLMNCLYDMKDVKITVVCDLHEVTNSYQ